MMTFASLTEQISILNFWFFVDKWKIDFVVINKDSKNNRLGIEKVDIELKDNNTHALYLYDTDQQRLI